MTRRDLLAVDPGRSMPLWLLRAAGVVAAAVSFALLPPQYALVVTALAALGALVPATLTTWAAAIVLGLAQVTQPLTLDGAANAMLLIVHLLHVLGGLCLALPARGRIQLRALRAPARRFAVLQLPAQLLLVLAIAAAGVPRSELLPAGAVAIGVALCVAVMIVAARWLLSRR